MTYKKKAIRPASLAASAVLAAASLAACGNGLDSSNTGSSATASPPASQSVTPTTSSTPAMTRSATPTPSPTRAATTSPSTPQTTHGTSPGNGICGVDQLSVGSRQPAGGASAGHQYLLITFTNTSPSTCVLDGHPGISFVGKGNGTQLGTPADRVGKPRRVSLPTGRTTTALLQIANAGDYGAAQCEPTTAEGFRVYPPGSRASVLVRYPTKACQTELGLGHSQLQISAVGRAQ